MVTQFCRPNGTYACNVYVAPLHKLLDCVEEGVTSIVPVPDYKAYMERLERRAEKLREREERRDAVYAARNSNSGLVGRAK